jgi:SAM-dependent methyltransferase
MIEKFMEKIHRVMIYWATKIPLCEPYYTCKLVLDANPKSVLDCGCGEGMSMQYIRNNFYTVGCDFFLPLLKKARRTGLYHEVVLSDVRALPFRPKSFEIVICLDVLEHLCKREGISVIQALEELASLRVVLSMPVGWQPRYSSINPLDKHRSAWSPEDLKKCGYHVYGLYFRKTWVLEGKSPPLLLPLLFVIQSLGTVISKNFNHLAGSMVCFKDLTSKKPSG